MAPRPAKPTDTDPRIAELDALLDTEEGIENPLHRLPGEDELSAAEFAARLVLRERDHREGCPVIVHGRGRVESTERRIVAPSPELRALGLEQGDTVTDVSCLECGSTRYRPGRRRDVLREAIRGRSPATPAVPAGAGADTTLTP